MRCLALVLALGLLASCAREPTPLSLTGEQLMVHSLLVADSDIAQVLLTRTLPEPVPDPDVPGGFIQIRPVSGARVRLIYAGTTLELQEAPEGFPPCFSSFPMRVPRVDSIRPGCYAAVVPGGIRPEQRYRLEIGVGGDGNAAEGSTEVPRAPEILAPQGEARFGVRLGANYDARPALVIPVRYRVPPQVMGVRLTLTVDSLFRSGERETRGNCSFDPENLGVRRTQATDSTALLLHNFYCFRVDADGRTEIFAPDSLFGRVALAGYDSAYVRYAEAAEQESAERSRLQAGITGALGLFTGAGIAAQPVVLIPAR